MKINGITVPDPTDMRITKTDVRDVKQTASGRTVIDYIATKYQLDITWRMLTDDKAQEIIGAISAPYFTITFVDTGGEKTINAYLTRFDKDIFSLYDGQTVWRTLSITVREA
jgi:hypothetical protein